MHIAVYRVNWLRVKARLDRCKEEVVLVRSEMDWTKRYYEHTKEKWLQRARDCNSNKRSLVFYALKQAYNWGMLENYAAEGYSIILKGSAS